jgi:hypothetical protein
MYTKSRTEKYEAASQKLTPLRPTRSSPED